jgi:hypothetical protein
MPVYKQKPSFPALSSTPTRPMPAPIVIPQPVKGRPGDDTNVVKLGPGTTGGFASQAAPVRRPGASGIGGKGVGHVGI